MLVSVLFAVSAAAVAAAPGAKRTSEARKHIDAAAAHFLEFDFKGAMAELGLARQASTTSDEDVAIDLYTGLVMAYQKKDDPAREAFRSALERDPNARLPIRPPPKLQAMFDEVKEEERSRQVASGARAAPPPPPAVTAPLPPPVQASPSATAPHGKTIAFIGLEAGPGVDDKTASLVGEALVTAVEARTGNKLVTARDVQQALGLERQRQLMGCSDNSECLAELGGALGADILLSGTLGRLGEATLLNVQLVNTRQGSVQKRVSARLDSLSGDAFLDAADDAVDQLFPAKSGEAGVLTAQERRALRQATSWEVLARVEVEPRSQVGGAMTLVAGYRPVQAVTVSAGGVFTKTAAGAIVRAAWVPILLDKPVHPFVSGEARSLFTSPVSIGLGASLGIEYVPARNFAIALSVPVSYFVAAPPDVERTYLFVAASTAARF